MTARPRLRLLAIGLVSTLGLGACGLLPGGDDEPAGTAAAPAPVDKPFELAGVCPNPVETQTLIDRQLELIDDLERKLARWWSTSPPRHRCRSGSRN